MAMEEKELSIILKLVKEGFVAGLEEARRQVEEQTKAMKKDWKDFESALKTEDIKIQANIDTKGATKRVKDLKREIEAELKNIRSGKISFDASRVSQLNASLSKANSMLGTTKQTGESAFSAVAMQAAALGAAIMGIVSALKGTIDNALAFKQSMMGLEALSTKFGMNFGEVKKSVQSLAKDGQVSITAIATSMKNLMSRGFSQAEAEKMIESIKKMAFFNRQAHLSMDDAVKNMTEGLKNEMSTLTDSAGATQNLSITWKKYADSLGKSVKDLTIAEKRQAELNWVLDEASAYTEKYNEALTDSPGKLGQLNASMTQLSTNIGNALLPIVAEIATFIKNLADGFNNLPAPVRDTIAVVGTVAITFGVVTAAVSALIPALSALAASIAGATGGLSLIIPLIAAGVAGLAALGIKANEASVAAAEMKRNITAAGGALDQLQNTTKMAADKFEIFRKALKDTGNINNFKNAVDSLTASFNGLTEAQLKGGIASLEAQLRDTAAKRNKLETELREKGAKQYYESAEYQRFMASPLRGDAVAQGEMEKIQQKYMNMMLDSRALKDMDAQVNQLSKLISAAKQAADNLKNANYKPQAPEPTPTPKTVVKQEQDRPQKPTKTKTKNIIEKEDKKSITDYSDTIWRLNEEYQKMQNNIQLINSWQKKAFGDELLNNFMDSWDGVVGAVWDFGKAMDENRVATEKLAIEERNLATEQAKLNDLKQKYLDAMKEQNRLEAEYNQTKDKGEKKEIEEKINAQIKAVKDLGRAYDAQKDTVENVTSGVADLQGAANDSLSAMSGGFLAVAQVVADELLVAWNRFDEVFEETADEAMAWGEAFESVLLDLISQIPIVGNLLAKLWDNAITTDYEAREENLAKINDAVSEFQHNLNMMTGEEQEANLDTQIAFYEQILDLMIAQKAPQEDLWAMEEKIYGLKQDKLRLEKNITSELKNQKKQYDNMLQSEQSNQLSNRAQEFERLVSSGKLNMGVTEDVQQAINFYQELANKATELGLSDAANTYLDKVASLEGQLQSSRSYGEETTDAQTNAAVDNLMNSIGTVETDAKTTVNLSDEGQELLAAIAENTGKLVSIQGGTPATTMPTVEIPVMTTPTPTPTPSQNIPSASTPPQQFNDWKIADSIKIRFHDGGLVGTDKTFEDLQNEGLKNDEIIAKLQKGEMVVPRSITENLLSPSSLFDTTLSPHNSKVSSQNIQNNDSHNVELHIGTITIQTKATTTDIVAKDLLRVLDSELKRNGQNGLLK